MKKFEFSQQILASHIAILGKAGSGKTVCAKGIVETLLERGERVAIIDPTSVWWGMKSSSSGKKGAYPIVIFGGERADVPINDRHGEAVAEIIGTSPTPAIIDTAMMKVGERTRFFADFANGLLRKNKGPLHLFIDEAHLFAPQGKVADPQSANMLHAANNLVSLGRARGLRVTMISQRPAKLHKDSLTQVETLIAMRLIAPQDRRAIEDWIADQADVKQGKEIIASLPTMKTGQGWVWAPEIGILERVDFPMIKTFDSSSAPGAGWNEALPTMAPINISQATKALQIFEEEVKANDPAVLRKRIKDLEAETKHAPVAPNNEILELAERQGFIKGKREGWNEAWQEAFNFVKPKLEAKIELPPQKPVKEVYAKSEMVKVLPIIKQLNGLSTPQQKIIDSLAFWASIGYDAPTREQVAAIANYSVGSGSFRNNLSALKTAGIIDYPSSGDIKLLDISKGKEIEVTEAAEIFLGYLSGPQKKMIEAFKFGQTLTRDELANRTGYAVTSGSFRNNVSALSTMKAFEKPGVNQIKLSEWVMAIL